MPSRTMSSVLSDFIDLVYKKFGENHQCSRMANDVILSFTEGADDEELSDKVQNILDEVKRLNT